MGYQVYAWGHRIIMGALSLNCRNLITVFIFDFILIEVLLFFPLPLNFIGAYTNAHENNSAWTKLMFTVYRLKTGSLE